MAERIEVITPIFRLSFPKVFKPELNDQGQPKFSIAMIFDADANLAELKAALVKARDAKWPDPAKRPGALKTPFRKGDEKAYKYPEMAGKIIANAYSSRQPGVVDASNALITNEADLYPGCYCRACVSVYGYENKSVGVTFGLESIQKVRDGDPLGGRVDPTKVFDTIESAGPGIDPFDAPVQGQDGGDPFDAPANTPVGDDPFAI